MGLKKNFPHLFPSILKIVFLLGATCLEIWINSCRGGGVRLQTENGGGQSSSLLPPGCFRLFNFLSLNSWRGSFILGQWFCCFPKFKISQFITFFPRAFCLLACSGRAGKQDFLSKLLKFSRKKKTFGRNGPLDCTHWAKFKNKVLSSDLHVQLKITVPQELFRGRGKGAGMRENKE